MRHSLVLTFFVFISFRAAAESPRLGPIFEDYGPTFAGEGLETPVDEDIVYRAVFDVAGYRGGTGALNSRLESVARFINMHVRHGVPLDKLDLAVVLHGEALKTALAHESYRQRYGADNPSLDLLEQLIGTGVQVYVCGQSLGFREVGPDELIAPVDVALSAMTMLVALQAEGYALLP